VPGEWKGTTKGGVSQARLLGVNDKQACLDPGNPAAEQGNGRGSFIDPERAHTTVEKLIEARRGELCPGEERMNYLRVEIKVCEACGTLWLRAVSQGVYCKECATLLSEFPAVRKSRRGRKRASTRMACAGGGR